ncbi:MAG TPA: cyanophycinase [Thermoanaerobaculia bacterium]|nr:cyanophycinase [Thermoanaerobaculia bacterium]
MRIVTLRLALVAAAALLYAPGCAHAPAAPASAGPTSAEARRGSLLIVGGGPIPDALIARFVELAGGRGRARILAMPMASEDADAGVEIVGDFRRLGAQAERFVLTRSEADSEAAARRIAGATGVWFGGGDQARLMAVLSGTRAEAGLRDLYLRGGGVLGGTSAGAAVMSTPMITGDERHPGGDRPPAKDSSDAFMTIARDDVVTASGIDLVSGVIVDQHFVRRRRHNRLLSLVLENPRLVGIGIDESTAVEVPPEGPWRVLGASVAVVYDARAAKITPPGTTLGAADLKLSVLPAGSTYDVTAGTATLP